MCDQNKTEIVMIMDASGSMSGNRQRQAVSGYNEFIQEQKKVPGECNVTLIKFNTEIQEMYFSKPISEIKDLTIEDFNCDGQTAINDTMGHAINKLGERLRDLPEEQRPGKIIVVVLTDGEENASREFNYEQIQEMMNHQRDVYNWQFLIMGSKEINASPDGHFAQMAGVQGPCGPRGLQGDLGLDGTAQMMFSASSAAVTRYRSGATTAVGYQKEDVKDLNLVASNEN